MTDDKKPADKKSFIEKAGNMAAIGAAVVGAGAVIAAVVPQDELAKKGLPALVESLKGIAHLSWLRLEEAAKKFRPTAFAWGAKLWSFIKWWTVLSFALVFAGIEVKTRFGSNFGHVLVAAGTISFAGLGILLYMLSEGIATILLFKFRAIAGILDKAASLVGVDLSKEEAKTPLEELGKQATGFHGKVKLVLAGAVVLCFSLLFTVFFPEWSTLGWTLVFWAMVAVALCAAIYLDMQMGKAIKVVFYATIALIIGTFVVFLLDRLTGGAIGFGPVRTWLRNVNASEVLMAIIVLIPVSLLLMGAFAKDKDRKATFVWAAKYVGIGCAFLVAFLLYKGTLNWKDLSGKEPPKAVSETIETIETASFKGSGNGSSNAKPAVPQGMAPGGGNYMPPITESVGSSVSDDPPPAPASRPSKPRAKKQPLPPLKAKKYEDAASAVDDLESLL